MEIILFRCADSSATKPNKRVKAGSNSDLDDEIAILLGRGMTLRQAYEQLGLHQPEENFSQDTITSCDSSSSGTTSINSQSSFSTLTMSLDSADFYPSKPNSAVEFYGNPLRRGQRRRSHRHRPDHHLAKEEVGIMVTIQHLLPPMTHRLL